VFLETSVQVLAPVTVFAKAMLKKVKAKFCLVLEVEDGFVSDLLIVVGKSTLKIK
jgi:hypothetical protein